MSFRTRNFARLCAATALAAGATGFFATPAFAAAPAVADFSIATDDITGPNGAPLAPGSDAVVNTSVANASSVVITGFELSLTLPAGVTFKGAAADKYGTCDYVGQTVTCDLRDGWVLVPAGKEIPAEKVFSSWEIPFQVTVGQDVKGPKLTGGKTTGKITAAADFDSGQKAEIAAAAAEFVPAAFNGSDSGVTLASFKEHPGKGGTPGKGGNKGNNGQGWKLGGSYAGGRGGCGHPPHENPPTTTTPPTATTPPPTTPSATPPATTTPPTTPSATPPATTTPPTKPPATPPVVHSDDFLALVSVPGGNGGGGEPPLPNTGVQVGVIGGVGAAVVAAGAAFFMMARRRRIVTVAPGDENSSL